MVTVPDQGMPEIKYVQENVRSNFQNNLWGLLAHLYFGVSFQALPELALHTSA